MDIVLICMPRTKTNCENCLFGFGTPQRVDKKKKPIIFLTTGPQHGDPNRDCFEYCFKILSAFRQTQGKMDGWRLVHPFRSLFSFLGLATSLRRSEERRVGREW